MAREEEGLAQSKKKQIYINYMFFFPPGSLKKTLLEDETQIKNISPNFPHLHLTYIEIIIKGKPT